MQAVTLSLDAMGGDHGPEVVIPAAKRALRQYPELCVIFVGDANVLDATLKTHGLGDDSRVKIEHASQVVGMEELPSKALRNKKDSSMRVAIDLVKKGRAQACVSAGNTGALMAIAKFVLKTLPGIDRPALISAVPSLDGHCHMLDLGANSECTAKQLFQFGVMGSVIVNAIHHIQKPRVGLLNIGAEETKGNEQIRQAARLLKGSGLNYIGYVEGDMIFSGEVDVVVCNGFVGNVALKTTEGMARFVSQVFREGFNRNAYARFSALVSTPVINEVRERLNPSNYNGATLVGLQGVVIKSHGGADVDAFTSAIGVALTEVEEYVPDHISSLLAATLGERAPKTSEAIEQAGSG